MSSRQKAVFLDRDGVVNIDHGYISSVADFSFIDDAFFMIREFERRGYLIIVVTNQSGIGRGYYSEENFHELNNWMLHQFSAKGITIGGVYYCPHAPGEGCSCRKPAPGMFLKAIHEHRIDPGQSWMVGDKESDMAAAKAAGIPHRVLFGTAESTDCTHRISALSELQTLIV